MSIITDMCKKKNNYKEEQRKATLDLLMTKTNNKLSMPELKRIYDIVSSRIISENGSSACIKESVGIISTLKEDWLTKEEKENIVAGAYLCECATNGENATDIKYINPEELKYTKEAVLGTFFK